MPWLMAPLVVLVPTVPWSGRELTVDVALVEAALDSAEADAFAVDALEAALFPAETAEETGAGAAEADSGRDGDGEGSVEGASDVEGASEVVGAADVDAGAGDATDEELTPPDIVNSGLALPESPNKTMM